MTFSAKPRHPRPIFNVDVFLRVQNRTFDSSDDEILVEVQDEEEKPMTRYFTWNEWIIYMMVCWTGCIYCICKRVCFRRIEEQYSGGRSSYGEVGPAAPGQATVELTDPAIYKDEDVVLNRRYARNKLHKIDE